MTSIPDIFGTMAYGPAPEAVAPAHAWLDRHGRRFGLFIGGGWTTGEGETFEPLNPATGKPLARLTQATSGDVDRAVRAARKAQPGWWALGGHGRARYLYAIARQIQKHSRLFAVLESLDNGKPIRESRDIDVPLVARHFYYHAGWAQLMEQELPDREPVGVIGQIIPWNFPLLMLAWKIAPALAMGNTVVLKPAEFTSLTALRFAELCEEIGAAGRSGQHHHRRRPHRRGARHPPGRRQDRLHRVDRSRADHPGRDRGKRQEALPRAGREVAVHRLSRRRSRQRGRRRGRCDLVQPGPGLLRRLAHPGAGGCRRSAGRQAQGADGDPSGGRPAGQGGGHGRDHRAGPAGEDPGSGPPRRGRRRQAVAALVELSHAKGGSSRPRCSPRCRPPRRSRRWRSSDRSWC